MALQVRGLSLGVCLLLIIAASEAALLTETHLSAEGKAASVSRLLQSLKATALLLGREDAFRKPREHWSCEAWPANILSAADRAQKDRLKPDNSVTSYLNCMLLRLVWWKLEGLSRARRFFFLSLWEGWGGKSLMWTVLTACFIFCRGDCSSQQQCVLISPGEEHGPAAGNWRR